MNYEACESFIEFCNDMEIATEKTNISISKKDAVKVSSIQELIARGSSGTPLMVATGKIGTQIANTIKEKKTNRNIGTALIVFGLLSIWPLLIGAIVQRTSDSDFKWVGKYKVVVGTKNYYIVRKGYTFV